MGHRWAGQGLLDWEVWSYQMGHRWAGQGLLDWEVWYHARWVTGELVRGCLIEKSDLTRWATGELVRGCLIERSDIIPDESQVSWSGAAWLKGLIIPDGPRVSWSGAAWLRGLMIRDLIWVTSSVDCVIFTLTSVHRHITLTIALKLFHLNSPLCHLHIHGHSQSYNMHGGHILSFSRCKRVANLKCVSVLTQDCNSHLLEKGTRKTSWLYELARILLRKWSRK